MDEERRLMMLVLRCLLVAHRDQAMSGCWRSVLVRRERPSQTEFELERRRLLGPFACWRERLRSASIVSEPRHAISCSRTCFRKDPQKLLS